MASAANDVGKKTKSALPGWMEMEWGSNACWQCWKLDPCCSDVPTAIKCIVCWGCFAPCARGKLIAHGEGQDCALVNHVLIPSCLAPCYQILLRRNVRGGSTSDNTWIGDIVCTLCCGPCTFCQILRQTGNDSWNWWDPLKKGNVKLFDNTFKPMVR
eukprot:GFYU01020631.1.p2 GENE.GFYU01020631.1~~GFYU01020631.1.p2  ORF type:complete len:157 (+),score=34.48 GFYU01020631.1:34-504(+)